jgi:hypothetical protein
MAGVVNVSADTVSRIWREHGLQPHRVRSFKLSNDPHFWRKLIDVVGLYVNTPEHAIVFWVDEKQTKALDSQQPGGRIVTHDYKDSGTTSLVAALELMEDAMLRQIRPVQAEREFLKFLRRLNRDCPSDAHLCVVLDEQGSNDAAEGRTLLEYRPRFNAHFIPTGTSWLTLVETRLSRLIGKGIRRGRFGSLDDLVSAIHRFLETYDENPRPFVWTASVESSLDTVKGQPISLTLP